MRVQVREPIPLPAQEAFLLIRDEMSLLVPYFDDVRSITVTQRRQDGDVVHLVNLWQLSLDKIPAAARKFVDETLFSWNDHASWTGATRAASWRLEPRVGGRVFECAGGTRVIETGGTARLEMDIDATIYPENVPGVPRLLARTVFPQIEGIIERALTQNMKMLPDAIRRYAAARR